MVARKAKSKTMANNEGGAGARKRSAGLPGLTEEDRRIEAIDLAAAALVEAEAAKSTASAAEKKAREDLAAALAEHLPKGRDRYVFGEWEAWLEPGEPKAKAKRIAAPQEG
jgi:hypothetical protein